MIPVNLNQYCGIVRDFNNCNLQTRKSCYVFFSRLLQQSLSKIYSTKILVFLLMIAIRFVIYIITAQNVRLVHRSIFKSLYFITVALYIHHVWVYFITTKLTAILKKVQVHSSSLVTVCLFLSLELKQYPCS